MSPTPLPFSPIRGFTVEQLVVHGLRIAVLGPALAGLAWGVAPLLPAWKGWSDPRLPWVAGAASLATSGLVMLGVFRGRAVVDDELTYAMQAEALGEGRLAYEAVSGLVTEPFTVVTPVGFTGKYLFGEPLVQVVGVLVGVPALLHLPLAAVTLVAFHRAVSGAAGRAVADWSVVLVAASPMFVLATATGLSHATALACVAVAGLGLVRVQEGHHDGGVRLLGLAIGFGVAVRVQSAVPAGAVLCGWAVWTLLRRGDRTNVLLLTVWVGLWAVAILAYNVLLTGSPLRMPWFLYQPVERYGFGPVWDHQPFEHTWRTALENVGVVAVRFNAWWLGWPLSLALLAVWWRTGRALTGAGPWLGVGAAVVVFELGYYSTGISDFGPIYHYELLLPAAVLGAHAIRGALDRAPSLASAALAVHFVLGTGTFLAWEIARVDRMVQAVHAQPDAALAGLPPRSLLLYDTDCRYGPPVAWVFSAFPRREWSDRDGVVTLPAPEPAWLDEYLARYGDRACFAYRPGSPGPEVTPCAETPWLRAPEDGVTSTEACARLRSTAEERGSFTPWTWRAETP